jgi:hypothetical protein
LIVLTASNNFNLGNPLHTYVPSLQRMWGPRGGSLGMWVASV